MLNLDRNMHVFKCCTYFISAQFFNYFSLAFSFPVVPRRQASASFASFVTVFRPPIARFSVSTQVAYSSHCNACWRKEAHM